MAVREYKVRGYRNTRYRAGVPEAVEFDRPLSKDVFESLYPDGDVDVIDLQTGNDKFLFRSIYYKPSVRVKHVGTQKDIIYQIDYLRIQAINGGNDRETAYYFVDTTQTEYISADTAVLYLTLDEQTTTDATQTTTVSGVIEKRNIEPTETELNFYPEEFEPLEPMHSDIAYITTESGSGYTVVSGIPKKSGTRTFVSVFCSLASAGSDPPVVNPLPDGGDSLTITVGTGIGSFNFEIPGIALVDPNNAQVKAGLTYLRKTGNEIMIGGTYTVPEQILSSEPIIFTDGSVPLIIGLQVANFVFTVDNLTAIPNYGNTYQDLINKKAGYLWCTYTLTAPATGDSKSFNLQEISDSLTSQNINSLPTSQIQITGTGLPISAGGMYFRPFQLSLIDVTAGYDQRVSFISTVRSADWNQDGLTVTGLAGDYLMQRQLQLAKNQYSVDQQQIAKQLELTQTNLKRERFGQISGLVSSGAQGITGTIAGGIAGGWKGAVAGALSGGASFASKAMAAAGVGYSQQEGLEVLGSMIDQQEQIAITQANLANRQNLLGLESVQYGYDYAKATQSLAVQPPSGLDMSRVMGSSLLITRATMSPVDVSRFDLYLTWHGTSVHERYSGYIKDHPHILSAGEDFSFLKLGMCTIALPNEKSGWGNTAAWSAKIQAEMQTGGRYWKKKIIDYVWKVTIPEDKGYIPQGGGVNPPTPGYKPVPGEEIPTQGGNISDLSSYTIKNICEINNADHFILWYNVTRGLYLSRVTEGIHYMIGAVTIPTESNGCICVFGSDLFYISCSSSRYDLFKFDGVSNFEHIYSDVWTQSRYIGATSYGSVIKDNSFIWTTNGAQALYVYSTNHFVGQSESHNPNNLYDIFASRPGLLYRSGFPPNSPWMLVNNLPINISTIDGSKITETGIGIYYDEINQKYILYDFLNYEPIEELGSITCAGAIFPNGLYYRDASNVWWYRYNDGTKVQITTPLSFETQAGFQFKYAFSNTKLYRIGG